MEPLPKVRPQSWQHHLMGSVSSWILLAVGRMGAAAAATTVQMTTPSGSAVPALWAPGFWTLSQHAGHLGCNATAVEAAPYPPLHSAPAQYLMLHGGNWGSATLPAHQRCVSHHFRWNRPVLRLEHQTPVVGIFCWLSPSLQSLLSKSSQPCSSSKICRTQRTLRFVSTAPSFIHVPPSVNVNPFTPETVRRSSELQWRNDFRGDDNEDYGRRYKLLHSQHFSS